MSRCQHQLAFARCHNQQLAIFKTAIWTCPKRQVAHLMAANKHATCMQALKRLNVPLSKSFPALKWTTTRALYRCCCVLTDPVRARYLPRELQPSCTSQHSLRSELPGRSPPCTLPLSPCTNLLFNSTNCACRTDVSHNNDCGDHVPQLHSCSLQTHTTAPVASPHQWGKQVGAHALNSRQCMPVPCAWL